MSFSPLKTWVLHKSKSATTSRQFWPAHTGSPFASDSILKLLQLLSRYCIISSLRTLQNSPKIHTFTVTPVLLVYNHVYTVQETISFMPLQNRFYAMHPVSGTICPPMCLLAWHFLFSDGISSTIFPWCLPWFRCTGRQNWVSLQCHVVHLTRSSPAPTISSLLHSRSSLVT